MICGNCNETTEVCIVEPAPSCPHCSNSAMTRSFVVHTEIPEGIIVTRFNNLGRRWESVYEETVASRRREQREKQGPPSSPPWWKRIFGFSS